MSVSPELEKLLHEWEDAVLEREQTQAKLNKALADDNKVRSRVKALKNKIHPFIRSREPLYAQSGDRVIVVSDANGATLIQSRPLESITTL